jgi:hypothetical protein
MLGFETACKVAVEWMPLICMDMQVLNLHVENWSNSSKYTTSKY